MNKKEYVFAIEEIKIPEKQKREVLEKMEEKKSNIFLRLSLATACVAIIVGAIIIPTKLINKPNAQIKNDPINQAQVLPHVKNFEELYAALKKNQKSSNYYDGNRLNSGIDLVQSLESAQSTQSITKETTEDYSETNVQVEGVDEADIVKTDGDYIYYVTNNSVVIINAKDVKNLKISSKIKFDNTCSPQEIYIEGNKLIIICSEYLQHDYFNSRDIIYSSNTSTIAKVYDTKNKEDIKLVREVKLDGNYVTSRMIGENVFLIANKYMYSICNNYDIEELKEEELVPKYRDTAVMEDEKCISYDSIYYIPHGDDSNYLNIASFNINDNKAANIASYIGAGDEVYASQENLYIIKMETHYSEGIINDIIGNYRYTVKTNICKFNMNNGVATYVCEGNVPGSVLNQFSMDENNGYFRIATTNSTSWNNSTNNLYVLNDKLETVGKVEDLAKGEKIYSVRFMGNKAYMVTFVQTDPLFVIDLSDPTNPNVLGELKIPGFSNYLHPYDENHIIGFGKDSKINNYGYGNVVTTTGMKMAMFDVTDVNNPKEMYSVKIGDSGTYSELLDNHKALLFNKEKELLTFPIRICTNTSYAYCTFQGAIVYNVNLENGFTLKGQISHKENFDTAFHYDSARTIERIIYIGNNLITLSHNFVKVTDMNTLETISEKNLEF